MSVRPPRFKRLRPDVIARRRFRCAVKVALPTPAERGRQLRWLHIGWRVFPPRTGAHFAEKRVGMYDLHEQLRRLFGRDGYAVVPSAWDGTQDAMAVLFDDPAKAFYVAAWADARWPR